MFNSYNPYYYLAPKTFSFTSLLNGASKTLNVLNQALPVYKEIKPIVSNARTLFNAYKSINTPSNTNIKTNNTKSNNSPSFFI